MIETPRIADDQQKKFRYDFVKMIEDFEQQDELDAFRNEWDGAVHFQVIDDHSTIVNIAGEEKLPLTLKEHVRNMRDRFSRGTY